jgi:hypothetical protein
VNRKRSRKWSSIVGEYGNRNCKAKNVNCRVEMQFSKVRNANCAHGNGNFAVRPANYADKDLNLRGILKNEMSNFENGN